MFSGIIEEKGTLIDRRELDKGFRFTFRAKRVLSKTRIGDSIAVEGICLTVSKRTWRTFTVDVMHETISRTALKSWQLHQPVNLERSLRQGQRNGGHNVQGHVDTVAKLVSKVDEGIATRLRYEIDAPWTSYMISKGSIAISGVSLTLTDVTKTTFEVSIIPHTKLMTTLMLTKIGGEVNIEVDILGKYIEKWIKK
jgi:riboflavin synthase